jgi:hypothetical protein
VQIEMVQEWLSQLEYFWEMKRVARRLWFGFAGLIVIHDQFDIYL